MKRAAPLQRRTSIKSKRATPRTTKTKAVCAYGPRCKKRPEVRIGPDERMCKGHATDTADRLVGDFVKARDGRRCQLVDFNGMPCWMPEAVYWCHFIPKGRYYGTRWIPDNAVTGCAGHHKAFDTSPLEKDDWIEARLGSERWAELRILARREKAVDVAEVIRDYRARARTNAS